MKKYDFSAANEDSTHGNGWKRHMFELWLDYTLNCPCRTEEKQCFSSFLSSIDFLVRQIPIFM